MGCLPTFGFSLGGFGLPGVGLGIGNLGYGYYGSTLSYYPSYNSDPYTSGYEGGKVLYYPDLSTTETPPPAADPTAAMSYLESAQTAFLAGDYAEAQRAANHALVDAPDQAKSHELMSLVLLAQKDYAGAAAAAHAAVALGSVADWPTLYGYYNDRDRYEGQYRALQQFVQEHPETPEGHFLLGMHHMMMGHTDSARKQFGEYLPLVNYEDEVGIKLYGQVGGDVAALPKPAPAPQPPEAAPGTIE